MTYIKKLRQFSFFILFLSSMNAYSADSSGVQPTAAGQIEAPIYLVGEEMGAVECDPSRNGMNNYGLTLNYTATPVKISCPDPYQPKAIAFPLTVSDQMELSIGEITYFSYGAVNISLMCYMPSPRPDTVHIAFAVHVYCVHP